MTRMKELAKSIIRNISPRIYNRTFVSYYQTISTALFRLKNLGFQPSLVFDVGAYEGEFTRSCLRLWPDSRFACFEVLPRKVRKLERFREGNPGIRVFDTLMGGRESDIMPFFQLEGLAETASTLLDGHEPFGVAPTYHPMSTVDLVVARYFDGQAPDLLKMDVQGYELEVLKGAEATLDRIEVILAEVNLLDLQKNVPLLADLVDWLDARDWVAYDICSLCRRPLDDALWQADFIFVRRNSRYRAEKVWDR